MGIGLTVLVAVVAVGAYTLGASISSWNDHPSTAATPTVHPAPMPSASSEPPMSGDYVIGPDGVLVRPAEFAADTYTKPELPEEAKENSERGAEAAAEHYLALMVYAWNTGDTQPFADITEPGENFRETYIQNIDNIYSKGWVYGNTSTITNIIAVEPVSVEKFHVEPNTIGVAFQIESTNGLACSRQKITESTSSYKAELTLFMTWKNERWVLTEGDIDYETKN